MPGILSPSKIEKLLSSEAIGRLACLDKGKIYLVPINYGYDGEYLYAHSKEGLKIDIMRENPKVCFEVDQWDDDGSWRSVIIWGEFEELKTIKSQRAGMKIFAEQMARVLPERKPMPSHGFVKGNKSESDPFKSVVFRISVDERTGRFENRGE
jgi:nitroimidazol reductase NimA-like FMN-containing flavoprotein (pyridoxamine 5'-phosphate oxidase superfamily)